MTELDWVYSIRGSRVCKEEDSDVFPGGVELVDKFGEIVKVDYVCRELESTS